MEWSMDVQTMIWLFPVVFILHDFEEIIMLESWIAKEGEKVSKILPNKISNRVMRQFTMTTAQMAVAVLVIFLFVSSATFMASQYVTNGPLGNIYFFTVLLLIFFIHVFTHVGQSILFRSITPGVVTSVLFVFPYSLLMLTSLLSSQLINWNTIWVTLPFAFLAIPVLLAAHWIGKKLI
ncbi:HXXEE domain-containing protein [Fredinandcohnia humi]